MNTVEIFDELKKQYDRRIMNNVSRSEYVECMIVLALRQEWKLMWEVGWEWAPWDCEHVQSRARLEVKQSAARQPWTKDSRDSRSLPRFDIAPRKGYWPRDGGSWFESPGRQADLYAFAWHPIESEVCDHRDPAQWSFYVVA